MSQLADRLREVVSGTVTEDAPLAPSTTFRVGGSADVLVEAESIEDLLALSSQVDGEPVTIVGRGSNMLVADAGVRGVVIKLGRSFRRLDRIDEGLRLGGATYLPAVARTTGRLALTGLEFAAEIPGSFGGAVRMNAGAHEVSIADVLIDVTVVDVGSGQVTTATSADLDFAYRTSSLAASQVVTEGRVRATPANQGEVRAAIASHLDWRRRTQPPGRSAGSVFKNPPGDSAGRLIDAAGGKGMSVGGAAVSDVHANFIVVQAGTAAADVRTLMDRMRAIVADATGIDLELEVKLVGFPEEDGQDEAGVEGR